MKHIRFYQEFKNKRKGLSAGTVFAAFVGDGYRISGGVAVIDGLGAVFAHANSAVAGTAASFDYLRKTCKRVSETKARKVHPALFARLDREERETA